MCVCALLNTLKPPIFKWFLLKSSIVLIISHTVWFNTPTHTHTHTFKHSDILIVCVCVCEWAGSAAWSDFRIKSNQLMTHFVCLCVCGCVYVYGCVCGCVCVEADIWKHPKDTVDWVRTFALESYILKNCQESLIQTPHLQFLLSDFNMWLRSLWWHHY